MDSSTMQEWQIARVDSHGIYAMYSGLALLLDVYVPKNPTEYGTIHISRSGWSAPLSPNARPLKEAGHVAFEAYPMVEVGYTIFTINHRAVTSLQCSAS